MAATGTTGPVAVGDRAPDFILPAQSGQPVWLADLIGKKAVVLYFYPKDGTKGCTAEACAFRDSYELFTEAGAEVIGVSADSVPSHQRFAAANRLPFILLSDRDGAVRKRYGVPAPLGVLPGRTTYVIDLEGVVRLVCSDLLRARRHVEEALSTVRAIADPPRTGSASA